MNLELYINNRQVELDEQFNIRLNKELYDTEALSSKEVSYSFTINIPTSQNNKTIFNYVDTEEVPNKFNQVYTAQLYANSTLIMDGLYANQEIDSDYYSGNLYTPSQQSLSDIFGDLAMSKIKKRMKYINTWNDLAEINLNALNNIDRYMLYPYILYNLPYNNSSTTDKYIQYDSNENGAIWNYDIMIPAFNVCAVIKDIFETFNLKVDGNVFTDSRFNELYMTIYKEVEDFYANKNVPYYAKFQANYKTRKNNNNDKTLSQITGKDNLRFFYSDLLLSDNTVLNNVTDEFGMLSTTTANNNVIHIKKAGWYRIKTSGNFNYNTARNNLWTQDGRYPVCGSTSSHDSSTLDIRPFELQIRKSSNSTLSTPTLVGVYGFQPSTNNVDNGNGQSYSPLGTGRDRGMQIFYNNSIQFPQNNKAMYIYDSSDPATNDFIHGAHFGHFGWDRAGSNEDSWKAAGSYLYNNTNPATKDANLQKSSNWYQFKKGSPETQTYDWQQANAMIRAAGRDVRSFGNWDATYLYNVSQDDESNFVKNFTLQNNKKTFSGLNNSSATTVNTNGGNWNCESVVWLDEGDIVDAIAILPLQEYGRRSCSFWRCTTKDRTQAAVDTTIIFNMEIGLINSVKDWNYEAETIPPFNELASNRQSNINALLPDEVAVNEFVNGFVDTFNLRLTKQSSNSYSIDVANDNDTIGQIVNIEPYTDISRNKYTRIDAPSEYQFNFSFDTDEEGYVQQGGNNLKPQGYTGAGIYNNPASTNGSINKRDSVFSYCWYKNIKWMQRDNTSTMLTVPIITDSEIWSDGISYAEAHDNDLYLNKRFRLFYPEFNQPLTIFPDAHNNIIMIPCRNGTSPDGTIELTYDKENTKAITNRLFNIKMSSGHIVEVPLYLPNYLFNNINSSTRFKMNNDLYQVKNIEGFDPLEEDETLLRLIKE